MCPYENVYMYVYVYTHGKSLVCKTSLIDHYSDMCETRNHLITKYHYRTKKENNKERKISQNNDPGLAYINTDQDFPLIASSSH